MLLADWAEKNGVALKFIQPDKPTQNSYIARFNRTYRGEGMDFYLSTSLAALKEITENWPRQHNEGTPSGVSWRFDPGRVPPEKFTQGSLYFWMALTWGGLHSGT